LRYLGPCKVGEKKVSFGVGGAERCARNAPDEEAELVPVSFSLVVQEVVDGETAFGVCELL